MRTQDLQEAARVHDTPSPPPMAAPAGPYDVHARELMNARSFPWSDALTTLESTSLVGVTATQVDFASGENLIRVEVSFSDYSNVLDYLNAVNAGGPRLRWSLNQTQGQSGNVATGTAVLIGKVGSP